MRQYIEKKSNAQVCLKSSLIFPSLSKTGYINKPNKQAPNITTKPFNDAFNKHFAEWPSPIRTQSPHPPPPPTSPPKPPNAAGSTSPTPL